MSLWSWHSSQCPCETVGLLRHARIYVVRLKTVFLFTAPGWLCVLGRLLPVSRLKGQVKSGSANSDSWPNSPATYFPKENSVANNHACSFSCRLQMLSCMTEMQSDCNRDHLTTPPKLFTKKQTNPGSQDLTASPIPQHLSPGEGQSPDLSCQLDLGLP